jgi:hypothetical protein
MYTKKNTRVTFRSNRRSNFKRNNNFSNKPRNKGNVTQQYNKYLKLAKEASSSGDRIQSEYYYQYTDHYYRLMIELGINLEENENQDDRVSELSLEEPNTASEDKKNNEVKSQEVEPDSNNDDADIESIESIPFISKPVKKKASRSKKVSV